MADEEIKGIVIDNGSCMLKAGFAGDDAPRVAFSTMVGVPRTNLILGNRLAMNSTDDKNYVGDEAQQRRGILNLTYPIEHGVVTNWDDMEKIWSHTFNQLKVSPENFSILLTEACQNPEENRIKMAEIMFEKFNVPSTCVCLQSALCLYGTGNVTGTVVQIGHGLSEYMPVVEGHPVNDAIERSHLAGYKLSEYLLELTGLSFNRGSQKEIAREIKERVCEVAVDSQTCSFSNLQSKEYELPDGQIIQIGSERFTCSEALFNPSCVNETKGVHELTLDSIMKCDAETRDSLCSNIVLAGGTTLIPGFSERFLAELKNLTNVPTNFNLISNPERRYLSWIGGSIVASLPEDQKIFISKSEYEEVGSSILWKNAF